MDGWLVGWLGLDTHHHASPGQQGIAHAAMSQVLYGGVDPALLVAPHRQVLGEHGRAVETLFEVLRHGEIAPAASLH